MSRARGAEPGSLCRQVRVALLHLAPVAGDVDHNLDSIEHGIGVAVAAGANLIVTPELATTGYSFAERIGTAWIRTSPDTITREVCAMARRHGVDVFLGHVERDEAKGTLHNALFAIGKAGDVLARHRKRNTLRVGAEAWSTPGIEETVVALDGGLKAGLLVCADACSPSIARAFDDGGASLLRNRCTTTRSGGAAV